MSRIGNMPVVLPEKVKVDIKGNDIVVSGPLGTVKRKFDPRISVAVENNNIVVKTEFPELGAIHGTTRAIINNMVRGVTAKFEKKLEIQGVGYKSQLTGKKLVMQLGYSHPVEFNIPADVDITVDQKGLIITLQSCDKEQLGFIASHIRRSKPPDPYKGKGVRYVGEYIKKKPGKSAVGVGTVAGAAGGAKK